MQKMHAGAARHQQAISSKGGKARSGVPKGWTADGIRVYRKNLRSYARKLLKRMIPHLSEEKKQELDDNKIVKDAVLGIIAISKDSTVKRETALAANRTLLEWFKAKPATKADVTIKKAEDFLKALADEDGRELTEGQAPPQG